MSKMWILAFREYRASVRSKAFVITLVAMPVMMGGSIILKDLQMDFMPFLSAAFTTHLTF